MPALQLGTAQRLSGGRGPGWIALPAPVREPALRAARSAGAARPDRGAGHPWRSAGAGDRQRRRRILITAKPRNRNEPVGKQCGHRQRQNPRPHHALDHRPANGVETFGCANAHDR